MTKTLFWQIMCLYFSFAQLVLNQAEDRGNKADCQHRSTSGLDNVEETNTAVGGFPCPTDSSTGRSQPLQESEWANPISSQNLFNEEKALSPDPSKLHVDLRLSAI